MALLELYVLIIANMCMGVPVVFGIVKVQKFGVPYTEWANKNKMFVFLKRVYTFEKNIFLTTIRVAHGLPDLKQFLP